ncbi:MAG: ERCC4 domain-containing protein [Thermodesulfobacteriota bacterium]
MAIILADKTEYRSKVPNLLKEQGHLVKRGTIKIGDYHIYDGYIVPGIEEGIIRRIDLSIERKATDFFESLNSGLLNEQCYRSSASFYHSIFMMEGNLKSMCIAHGFNFERAHNALMRCCLARSIDGVQGTISVYTTADQWDSARAISAAAKILNSERAMIRFPEILTPKVNANPKFRLQQMIATLPHVGPNKAHLIMEQFGTWDAFYMASKKEIEEIVGIGSKVSKAWFELRKFNYNEEKNDDL